MGTFSKGWMSIAAALLVTLCLMFNSGLAEAKKTKRKPKKPVAAEPAQRQAPEQSSPAAGAQGLQDYSFEDGTVSNWIVKKNSVTLGSPYNSQAYAYKGLHSLAFPLQLDQKAKNGEIQGEAVVYYSEKPRNFSKVGKIILYVRVVGGEWNENWIWVQPYFFRYNPKTDNWDYISEKGEGLFPKDRWRTIVWNISEVVPREKIGEFGFWVSGAQDAKGRAVIYVDEIQFVPEDAAQ